VSTTLTLNKSSKAYKMGHVWQSPVRLGPVPVPEHCFLARVQQRATLFLLENAFQTTLITVSLASIVIIYYVLFEICYSAFSR
jgi:hypothetical protein